MNEKGLSKDQAKRLLEQNGFNELSSHNKKGWIGSILKILAEPMLLLLLGCGILYLFMGEKQDAMILLSAVFVVIGITFFQERKTEKTLEALKNMSSPMAKVLRDGEQIWIPGREVVVGDVVIINEGDRVPADATIISQSNLQIDESMLTGESVPVRKDELGEIKVYSGCLVISGHAMVRVSGTGMKTEIGKIGNSLQTIKEEETLLHKQTTKIVRTVAIIGISLSSIMVLIYTVTRGNVVEGMLAGLTLGMAILPEEFPIVLLIFMTLGAWRIAKNNVLTRKSSAIETLGAATVLCTDKTGTLTENNMKLEELWGDDKEELMKYGVLACPQNPFDPMEKELVKNAEKINFDFGNWKIIDEDPLTSKKLAVTYTWQNLKTEEKIMATKGAPETVLKMCKMSENDKAKIMKKVMEMANKGYRVIACSDGKYKFLGLFGFIDPIRESVPNSIVEAYRAGIRVIVITGDYPGTVMHIAKSINLKNNNEYILGSDLEKMDKSTLREKVKTVNIYARILPEQKLLIVNALKDNGEIVAMTGDGVNDAPALKSAHIGIAMGKRGTDVAREASSLVLLDDNFSSIVTAVRLGRRIYDNIKRAMGYILAVHVPIAGMSLLPLFFDYPVVLFPAHIAFLELIIDPACSTVFESVKEDEHIMDRPPRKMREPLFDTKTIILNLLQGTGILVANFGLYIFAIKNGRGEEEARSMAFACLVMANLVLITINLSWRKNIFKIISQVNNTFLVVFLGTITALLAVIFNPFLSGLLHMSSINFSDFGLILSVTIISLVWFEGYKWIRVK
ncbi:MAG: cation-translocating P-type ATPase [Candidatus Shapirobacteria bacterium]